ncbi:isotrichodermin C-15 hydroxylase [Xylariaceae sp. FL0804]|nr:isotrichodermin C-15 hydroxylase [Xylariaceae sp. FL0804]
MALLHLDNVASLAGATAVAAVIYALGRVWYNLFLHPLASFPGPLLWRLSRIPWTAALLRARIVFDVEEMHKRYGPVVRIAPDELAFQDPRAWRDVMGGGASEIPKWIGMYGVPSFLPPHLQNTISKEHHRTLRRAMAPGFSDASLRAQEPMLTKYIDLLVRRLRQKCEGGNPVDLQLWYEYVTFDIICDLAVGESFLCLESDGLHPWVAAMVDGGKPMSLLTAINVHPVLAAILNPFLGMLGKGSVRLHSEMVKPVMLRRLDAGNRPDLIEPLVKLYENENSTIEELITNAMVVIGAGAETSAGTLTAVTAFLIDNPDKLEKLASEVRSAFQEDKQITAVAASRLPYLVACIDEAMRLFPQTGAASLRCTEKDRLIAGVPVPKDTVVGIWAWPLFRAPSLWTDPEEFRPERFLGDEKYAEDAREALRPFSAGTRDCIGQNLALMELRTILARMVFNFNMRRTSDPNSQNWPRNQRNLYFVWEKSPLPVQLTPVR